MTARGLRNNNPGNIEDGPFARSLPGYVGSDGRFAIFDSPDAGNAAIDRLLTSYGQKGINTVAGVISRWAPASDNNPVPAYAGYVAKNMGVEPTAVVDMTNPTVRQALAKGISAFENGTGAVSQPAGTMPHNGPVNSVPQHSTAQPDNIAALFTDYGQQPFPALTQPPSVAQVPPVFGGDDVSSDSALQPRAFQLPRLADRFARKRV